MKDELTRVGKRFVAEVQRDDVGGMAAELAYRFLFAIFPFGIFAAALTAFVAGAIGIDDPTGKILGAIGDNLPAELAQGVRPQIEAVIGQSQPGLLTFGAVAALWAATGGTNALIKAMNRAYEVEETRPFVRKTALAIGLTLLASVGILVAFVTIVGASLLTTEVVRGLNLDQGAVELVGLLRWPVVFVFLSLAVGVLYKLAPNVNVPFRWCVAGGALFAACWLIATALFAFYVSNFANYANTYGALGGVIVLMLWFYISAFVLVAAAALVAAALKETRPEAIRERSAGAPSAANDPNAREATAPAPVAAAAVTAIATDHGKRKRPPVGAPRLRRPVVQPPPPEPGDWAFAAAITGVGLSIGAIAAWVLKPRR